MSDMLQSLLQNSPRSKLFEKKKRHSDGSFVCRMKLRNNQLRRRSITMSFLAGTLSQFWLTGQGGLFPWLAAEVGELSGKQKQLVGILEFLKVVTFLNSKYGYGGRPQEDRRAIARAFVVKAVENLGSARRLT